MVIIAKNFIKQQLSQTFFLTHKTYLFIETTVKTVPNALVQCYNMRLGFNST